MKYVAIAVALFFSAQASAMECISAASDPDGDGWGWENGDSCTVSAQTPTNTSATTSACLDTDPVGDGWGWDGSASCRVGGMPTTSNPATSAVSVCIDTDPVDDGWGWDGSSSCRVGGTPATTNPATSTASTCVDTNPVGDGWGWDGSSSCRVGGTPTTTNPPTPAASVCVDTDPVGDGWGWDGSTSCRVAAIENATSEPTVELAPEINLFFCGYSGSSLPGFGLALLPDKTAAMSIHFTDRVNSYSTWSNSTAGNGFNLIAPTDNGSISDSYVYNADQSRLVSVNGTVLCGPHRQVTLADSVYRCQQRTAAWLQVLSPSGDIIQADGSINGDWSINSNLLSINNINYNLSFDGSSYTEESGFGASCEHLTGPVVTEH